MTEHSPDILEELEYLFAWNPVAHTFVSPHEADTLPVDSREATFYDMHLASDRICKRIVHVKNLHRKVAHVVDEKLRDIQERAISFQPPTVPGFISKAWRDEKLDPVTVGSPMDSRQSVAEYYLTMTSDFCAPVASSLALHPKRWSRLVRWSKFPYHVRLGGCAPSLQLIPMEKINKQFMPDYMTLEAYEQLKKVRAKYNDLATWEIRSLSIDDTDAMLGIMTMALASGEGKFQWKLCSGTPTPVDASISKMLSTTLSFDAFEILSLVEEPWLDQDPTEGGVSRHVDSPASVLDETLRRGGSSFQSVREDIHLKQSEPYIEWDSESETETAARAASKARAINEMSWTPPAAGHMPSQELIQKAWAQSVRQDSTLLVLHAGNYEYVCIRHRETQTLYISDILHIPFLKEPGYGKVQVGIYIMALDDALRRIALDDASGAPDGVADRSVTKGKEQNALEGGDSTNVHKATVNKRSRTPGRGRSKKRQRTVNLEWTIQQAASRQFLLLHLYYDIYDTVHPEIFHRVPLVDSEEEDITPEPVMLVSVVPKHKRLLLFLNSELGQGATGVVHGGVLEVESDHESSRLNIAAKLSFTDAQRERLQQEWLVYMHLMSEDVGGIPAVLGIFFDPELEDRSPLCLLMCHAGVSLQRSGTSITSTQRDTFLAILKSIHRAGVYHGDLRYENLVINPSGEVAIIDFDRAVTDAEESDKKGEYRKLCRLLESRIDDSVRDEARPEGSRASRARKQRGRDDGPVLGPVTRSMGTAKETSSGMRLRPRR